MRMAFFVLILGLNLAAQDYQLVRSWGERGDLPGQLRGAHGICIDKNNRVIVVDSRSSHVYRYTTEGKWLDEIGGGPGTEPGQFKEPRDAVMSADSRIFVADGANNRIQVFREDGKWLRSLGSKGSGPGEFLRDHALDFSPSGQLFIADVDNSRIAVYDSELRFLHAWGKAGTAPGEFHAPHGLGVNLQGEVMVSNYYGPVQKFTPQGKLLQEFGVMTPENKLKSYHSMCLDSEGNIYLTTRDLQGVSSIMRYNPQGKLLDRWPMPSREQLVEDVAVDPSGRVFVTYQGRQGTGVHVFAKK